jgi:urease accessory protein UreF
LFDRVLRATPPDDVSLRARLLDWMQHQLRLAPESRAQVMERGERYAALFTQADCPLDLRETFEQLRSGR